jgi:hypothetical protein
VFCDTEIRKETCSGGRTRTFSYFLQVLGITRHRSLSHLHYYAVAIVFWRQAWYSAQLHVNIDARVPPCPECFATFVFWGAEERLTIVSITVMELFNYMKWKSRYSPGKHSFPDDAHRIYVYTWECRSKYESFRPLLQTFVQTVSEQDLVTVRCLSLYVAVACRCGDKLVFQTDNSSKKLQTGIANERWVPINRGIIKPKLNSVAVVRKRTIPTERSPLVGEVSANLWG